MNDKTKKLAVMPGTPEWDAVFECFAGSARQRTMRDCLISGRPYHVEIEQPWPRQHEPAKRERTVRHETIDDVADRLERRAEADAEDARRTKERHRSEHKRGAAAARAFDQVNSGNMPSVKGASDLGVITTHDPDEIKEVLDGKRAPEKVKPRAKLTNLRDDPVGLLHRRSQVSDLQLAGARTWQAHHDAAAIGGARAIDPAREKVDGGKLADPNTDARLAAMKALARIDGRLGVEGAMLVRRVLGEAMELQRVAAMMGDTRRSQCEYLGRRLRECLDTIVDACGLKADGPRRRSLADVHAEMAGVARAPELHRAVRRAKAG
jgi:hypothetical protein